MSLDFWPGTEIRRSTNNAFTIGYGCVDPAWQKMADEAAARAKQDEGRKKSPPKPMSIGTQRPPRSHRRTRVGMPRGAALNPNSHASKIRKVLAEGRALTRLELATVTGLPYLSLAGLMKNDIKHGRVVVIAKEGCLHRFALAEEINA